MYPRLPPPGGFIDVILAYPVHWINRRSSRHGLLWLRAEYIPGRVFGPDDIVGNNPRTGLKCFAAEYVMQTRQGF